MFSTYFSCSGDCWEWCRWFDSTSNTDLPLISVPVDELISVFTGAQHVSTENHISSTYFGPNALHPCARVCHDTVSPTVTHGWRARELKCEKRLIERGSRSEPCARRKRFHHLSKRGGCATKREEEGQGGLYGPRSGSHVFETVMAGVVGHGARAGILFFPV